MAPLTWREVAAPNFSGVADAQRLAGQLLSNGLGSAIDAIGTFQEGQRTAQSNELAARIAAFGNDQAGLEAARKSGALYQGLDPSQISLETQKFNVGRDGEILANQGRSLQNASLAEQNSQQAWQNQLAKGFEAGRPAAVARMNEIKSLVALGTPEGRAQADQLMRESSGIFAAAGMTPDQITSIVNGNLTTSEAGIALNGQMRGQEDAVVARNRQLQSEQFFTSVMKAAGNDTVTAERLIREDTTMDPTVKAMTLARFMGDEAKLLQGPDANPGSYIVDEMLAAKTKGPVAEAAVTGKPIVYMNENAVRNDPMAPKLESIVTPILTDLGITMQVFSGGQESEAEVAGGKGARTGSPRHDHGGAADVEFLRPNGEKLDPKNPEDVPILQEIVRRGYAAGITGWGEGEDYMGSGRVHLGFGAPALWGKDGKSENAPQWLKDAIKGVTPGAAPSIDEIAQIARTGRVPGAAPPSSVQQVFNNALGKDDRLTPMENQALFQGAVDLANQVATIKDGMQIDAAFGTQALALSLTDPSLQNESQAASIERVKQSLGDGVDLNKDELISNINSIKDKYGMSFGQAASVIENSLQQEPWILQWLQGKTNVDFNALDKFVAQVYNKDGVTRRDKLRPAMQLAESGRSKQQTVSQLDTLQQSVQTAQQRYANLLARTRSVSTPALMKELARAQLEYQAQLAKLQQLTGSVANNPALFPAQ